MAVADVTLGFDPTLAGAALGFVLGGILLGTVSGLVPGLHANNFALLLVAIAPAVPGPPLLVGLAMLAAGVVHTFLDVVPTLALGVPDADMAAMALPGHRLVIEGRGYEALRLSALGSGIAVVLALPLAVPITLAMVRAWPTLDAHMPLVLAIVALVLLVTEPNWVAAGGGGLAFVVSSALGLVTLDLDPDAPMDGGGMLAPLFAGLFGAPVLVDALRGAGVPTQKTATVQVSRRAVAAPAAAGSMAGAIVGYLPGVSSAIAAVIALLAVPGDAKDRGFIVATSGVNTSNTIFALFALVALGSPRTGVLVALENASVPIHLPFMLGATLLAAAVGFVMVVTIGDVYLRTVGRLDYTLLSGAILVLLTVLSFLFAGPIGVGVFALAIVIGFIPVRLGAKRVHLMGVLMGPIMLGW